DLQLEFARIDQVVAVEMLNELAGGNESCGFARSARPAVLNSQRPDLGMFARECFDRTRRVVSGTVVDDDDLDRTMRLREHAVDGVDQHRGAVVDGNDRRDEAGHGAQTEYGVPATGCHDDALPGASVAITARMPVAFSEASASRCAASGECQNSCASGTSASIRTFARRAQ